MLVLKPVDVHDGPGSNQRHDAPDVFAAVEANGRIESAVIQIAGQVAVRLEPTSHNQPIPARVESDILHIRVVLV